MQMLQRHSGAFFGRLSHRHEAMLRTRACFGGIFFGLPDAPTHGPYA